MRYQLYKVFNVIFRLIEEDGDDANVISFSTRYEAKEFFDKCREELKRICEPLNLEVIEIGNDNKGDMNCYTEQGPYLYVRLQGCNLCSSSYRIGQYFNDKGEYR